MLHLQGTKGTLKIQLEEKKNSNKTSHMTKLKISNAINFINYIFGIFLLIVLNTKKGKIFQLSRHFQIIGLNSNLLSKVVSKSFITKLLKESVL